MKGSRVDRDFQAVAAGGADAGGEEAVLAGQFLDFGDVVGMGGDEHGGGRLGEEAEERMDHERLILLDGCADALGKCSLGQGYGDAAVGDVAGGTEQLALGEHGQQLVQAASASRSSGGGWPQMPPRTTLANSDEPKAARSVVGRGLGRFRVLVRNGLAARQLQRDST